MLPKLSHVVPKSSPIDAREVVLVAGAGSEEPWGRLGRTLGAQRGARRSFWRPRDGFWEVFGGPKVIKKHVFFEHRFFMKKYDFLRIVLAP